MSIYDQWKVVLRIQKFRRIVSYTGFYCFVVVLSYAYTSTTYMVGSTRSSVDLACTRALALKTVTKLLFPIDTRFRYHPSLPDGYYGTAVVFPCAVTTPEALFNDPIRYAAELISGVRKLVVGDEYRKSVFDFIEVNGGRGFCLEGAFVVLDMSRLRFADVDLGWGPGVYGGPERTGTGMVPGMVTSVIGHKDERGVEGVLTLVSLLEGTVEMFEREIREKIRRVKEFDGTAPVMVRSAL